jgi:hypothetical protein
VDGRQDITLEMNNMKKEIVTNPNGANQYTLDPRQKLCWERYINPKSKTYSNALQSALAAGYTETTAHQITTEKWFIEKVRRINLLGKGEKVLEETLDYDSFDPETGKVDASVGRLKLDAAKHVTSTLGKDDGYSQKQEVTVAVERREVITMAIEQL